MGQKCIWRNNTWQLPKYEKKIDTSRKLNECQAKKHTKISIHEHKAKVLKAKDKKELPKSATIQDITVRFIAHFSPETMKARR